MITINSLKYDMKVRRSWTCELLEQNDDGLSAVGTFQDDVEHPGLGSIASGTTSYEYYWFKRWYNVFKFHEPDGTFRNFYCNVSMPPTLENNVLSYVDLDIDVVVWRDLSYDVLDRDDFERNRLKYGYTAEIMERTEASLAELIGMIKRQETPFHSDKI